MKQIAFAAAIAYGMLALCLGFILALYIDEPKIAWIFIGSAFAAYICQAAYFLELDGTISAPVGTVAWLVSMMSGIIGALSLLWKMFT